MPVQQDELYDAQDRVEHGREFASIGDVQVFIDGLRQTWWWKAWMPGLLKVHVRPATASARTSSAGYAGGGFGTIWLVRGDLNTRTVVHELAHVAAGYRHGSQSHDPWYARSFLELTHVIMGGDAAQRLAAGYREYGVDYDADGLARRIDR